MLFYSFPEVTTSNKSMDFIDPRIQTDWHWFYLNWPKESFPVIPLSMGLMTRLCEDGLKNFCPLWFDNFLLQEDSNTTISNIRAFQGELGSILKRPGQMETQVENLGRLVSPFGQALRALAFTGVDLPSHLVEIKSTHAFYRLATQLKSREVAWRPFAFIATF